MRIMGQYLLHVGRVAQFLGPDGASPVRHRQQPDANPFVVDAFHHLGRDAATTFSLAPTATPISSIIPPPQKKMLRFFASSTFCSRINSRFAISHESPCRRSTSVRRPMNV